MLQRPRRWRKQRRRHDGGMEEETAEATAEAMAAVDDGRVDSGDNGEGDGGGGDGGGNGGGGGGSGGGVDGRGNAITHLSCTTFRLLIYFWRLWVPP
jgi:hypothetical protein